MAKEIELKVDWHPSGNRTLKQRNQGDSMWEDVQTPRGLLANDNDGIFYRQVAKHLSSLSARGIQFHYDDTQADRENGL